MQIPLRITFHNIEPSPAIEERIRENVTHLEKLYGRITGCRVTVDAPHHHHHKGNAFEVKIDLTVPGAEIVVSREPTANQSHTDVYVALRDAFNAAARKLEDHTRRRRGFVKKHEAPHQTGRVVRLFRDDGYGFIESDDGLEIYFHENAVTGEAFALLHQGCEVRFSLATPAGDKGPQASTVHRMSA